MNTRGRRFVVRQAIKLLESELKTLEVAKVESGLLGVLSEMIEHIRLTFDRSESAGLGSSFKSIESDAIEGRDLKTLPADEIEQMLLDKDLERKILERIAVVRFGVPSGSLKSLGNKDGLRNKITTMVRNERVHRAIGEVASHSKTSLTRR